MPLQDSPCAKPVINDECELTFAHYKLQALIAKKIDLKYGVMDLLTLLAIIVALGSMIVSLGSVLGDNNNQSTLVTFVTFFVLGVSLIYAFIGAIKQVLDPKAIEDEIKKISNAIQTYKQNP